MNIPQCTYVFIIIPVCMYVFIIIPVCRYIEIVQSFIGYGLHLFKVRDKREVYYSVGIGREGVSIYHLNNKHHPAEVSHVTVM